MRSNESFACEAVSLIETIIEDSQKIEARFYMRAVGMLQGDSVSAMKRAGDLLRCIYSSLSVCHYQAEAIEGEQDAQSAWRTESSLFVFLQIVLRRSYARNCLLKLKLSDFSNWFTR